MSIRVFMTMKGFLNDGCRSQTYGGNLGHVNFLKEKNVSCARHIISCV